MILTPRTIYHKGDELGLYFPFKAATISNPVGCGICEPLVFQGEENMQPETQNSLAAYILGQKWH